MPSKGFIGSVIKVGDVVVAEVLNEPASAEFLGQLRFIRLERDSAVSRRTRDLLVDPYAEKRPTVRGGFARDASFRMAVTATYSSVCCMCGARYSFRDSTAMEAAHIIPRSKRGADHVSNGLCLCPAHHWAFDRGLIALTSDLRIAVAAIVSDSNVEAGWISDLNGRPAFLIDNPPVSLDALKWHFENVFMGH